MKNAIKKVRRGISNDDGANETGSNDQQQMM